MIDFPSVSSSELRSALAVGAIVGSSTSPRRLEASDLAAALKDPDLTRSHLRLQNVTIRGHLDLDGVEVDCPLTFVRCTFSEQISMSGCRTRSVDISECSLVSLLCRDLAARASVSLRESNFSEYVDLHNCDIAGDVNLEGATVRTGNAPCVFLRQATVSGSINLTRLNASNNSDIATVTLDNASAGGRLALSHATLTNAAGPVVGADRVAVKGGISLDGLTTKGGTQDEPALNFNGAETSAILLYGAVMDNPVGVAFRGVHMRILDSFGIRRGTRISGRGRRGALRISQSRIDGDVDLSRITVENVAGPGIEADGLQVGGSLHVEKATLGASSASYGLNLRSAKIGLKLEMKEVYNSSSNNPLISMDQTTLGSVLIARIQATCSSGHELIRMVGIRVSGQLACELLELSNAAGSCLSMQAGQVGGTLIIRSSTMVSEANTIAVKFDGMRIGNQLDVIDVEVTNLGGRALSLQSSEIGGSALIRRASLAAREVALDMYAVRVASSFQLENCTLTSELDSSPALLMQVASVGNAMRLDSAGLISRAGGKFRIDLEGVIFGVAAVRDVPTDQWLRLLRDYSQEYSPQPYERLATVYQLSGQPLAARDVRIAQEQARAEGQSMRGLSLAWHNIKGAVIGYGYRSSNALWYLFGIGVLAIAITIGLNLATPENLTDNFSTPALGDCSIADQILLAVDSVIPLVGAGFKLQPCSVSSTSGPGQVLVLTLGVLRLLGWFFAALFVAGFTGLVKKS